MLCRLCIYNVGEQDSVKIFTNEKESVLIKQISQYLNIEISQNDDFSDVVCKDCCRRLNDFLEFRQYVKERQQELQNEFIKVNCDASENMVVESEDDNNEKCIEMESIDNNDQNSFDEESKFEEFGYAEDSDELESQTIFKKQNGSTSSKSLRCSRKNDNSKASGTIISNEEVEKESILNISSTDTQTSMPPEENMSENDIIAKYMTISCEICQKTVKDFAELKSHFREKHNLKAYVTCCDMRFTRRFQLVDHIRKHLNPEHFRCNLCDGVFKNRNTLQIHNAAVHADKSKLIYSCKICDRRFAFYGHLSSHLKTHNDKKNHICTDCSKGFKSQNLLKTHIRVVHGEFPMSVCDVCGKEYKSKQAFARHMDEHQRQSDLPLKEECKYCGNMFSIHYMQRHLKIHELGSVSCEKCGKRCKSISALAGHIAYAHKEKRTYSCTLCDKKFYRTEYLKEHINRHKGIKGYFCEYCPREFHSKANMYGHVKRAHFEEWKKAKLRKNSQPSEVAETTNEMA